MTVYGNGRYVLKDLDWSLCGTEKQAAAHRRRGDKPCEMCRKADNKAKNKRWRRAKGLIVNPPMTEGQAWEKWRRTAGHP